MDIVTLDAELARLAPRDALARLAGAGLRGESAFCTPVLLRRRPALLGYYRLLLGFSQKAFYATSTGLVAFKPLEDGKMPAALAERLDELCLALNNAAGQLVTSLTPPLLSQDSFGDLALLTLGAQLRGGANVQKGALGIERVFLIIQEIVAHTTTETTTRCIALTNNAGRSVRIEFAADPDIIIREALSDQPDDWRNVIAIEIKAGTDFSNIHNRVGEAEKSHQKARKAGYTECWTIVNVDPFDVESARMESPSTSRFYRMSALESRNGPDYADFKARVLALASIAAPPKTMKRKSAARS